MKKPQVPHPASVRGPSSSSRPSFLTVNYFDPPHGGRPPSDEAVRAQTARYVAAEEAERLRRENG